MPSQIPRLVASSFGLVAFALAVVVGLSVGNAADAILSRAILSMLPAVVCGWAVGLVCQHVVKVTSSRIDADATATIAEEEAALHALMHPSHGAHHGHGAGHHGHEHGDGAHAPSGGAAKSGTASGGAPSPSAQPVVGAAAGRG